MELYSRSKSENLELFFNYSLIEQCHLISENEQDRDIKQGQDKQFHR